MGEVIFLKRSMSEIRSDSSQGQDYSLGEVLVGIAIFTGITFLAFFIVLEARQYAAQARIAPEELADAESSDDIGFLADIPEPEPVAEKYEESYLDSVDIDALALPVGLVTSNTSTIEPENLIAPRFSFKPGQYPRSQFPIKLNIINPNDNFSTWTMLSLNNGPFSKFSGGTIHVLPGDKVKAYIRGDTRLWNESQSISGEFSALAEVKDYKAPYKRVRSIRSN